MLRDVHELPYILRHSSWIWIWTMVSRGARGVLILLPNLPESRPIQHRGFKGLFGFFLTQQIEYFNNNLTFQAHAAQVVIVLRVLRFVRAEWEAQPALQGRSPRAESAGVQSRGLLASGMKGELGWGRLPCRGEVWRCAKNRKYRTEGPLPALLGLVRAQLLHVKGSTEMLLMRGIWGCVCPALPSSLRWFCSSDLRGFPLEAVALRIHWDQKRVITPKHCPSAFKIGTCVDWRGWVCPTVTSRVWAKSLMSYFSSEIGTMFSTYFQSDLSPCRDAWLTEPTDGHTNGAQRTGSQRTAGPSTSPGWVALPFAVKWEH